MASERPFREHYTKIRGKGQEGGAARAVPLFGSENKILQNLPFTLAKSARVDYDGGDFFGRPERAGKQDNERDGGVL